MTVDELIGTLPRGGHFEQQMRYHQGWWRACVLNELEGPHPTRPDQTVCNVITGGESCGRNFVGNTAFDVAKSVVAQRTDKGKSAAGLMHEGRLYNNLLSSQPLAFNFFGPLARSMPLATAVLGQFVELDEVTAVEFEYAGEPESTGSRPDNSAFDVAVKFIRGGRPGLLGIECKYTDSLDSKKYDKPAYKELLADARTFRQNASYDELTRPSFNQLFRNQLILERLMQVGDCEFGESLVFCHGADDTALETAVQFGSQIVKGPTSGFGSLTYQNFIVATQRLELTWEEREWTMLLWARFCATLLSEPHYQVRRDSASGNN